MQLINALFPISINDSGRIRPVNNEQLANDSDSIILIFEGIVNNLVKLLELENAFFSIISRLLGSIKSP